MALQEDCSGSESLQHSHLDHALVALTDLARGGEKVRAV